jgi:hypothetical protein
LQKTASLLTLSFGTWAGKVATFAEVQVNAYRRAVWGAEAGAIAAGALELSFFLLDLVRLDPLATPGTLAGVLPGPGGLVVDLTSFAGIADGVWAGYQIGLLTAVHFLTFGLVGVVVSLLFDWRQPFEAKRLLALAALCSTAFFATVAISGSLVAIDTVGWLPVVAANFLAAAAMGGGLRLVAHDDEEDLLAGSPDVVRLSRG